MKCSHKTIHYHKNQRYKERKHLTQAQFTRTASNILTEVKTTSNQFSKYLLRHESVLEKLNCPNKVEKKLARVQTNWTMNEAQAHQHTEIFEKNNASFILLKNVRRLTADLPELITFFCRNFNKHPHILGEIC